MGSRLTDLAVDTARGMIFCADAGLGGSVVVDLIGERMWRALDRHLSTQSEGWVV